MRESNLALDCSRAPAALKWFAAGALILLLPLLLNVLVRGNTWRSLLPVGRDLALRPWIERELGQLHSQDPLGHDGQLYFAIARDPLGVRGVPELLARSDDHPPSYRYRRILFPLLSGAFGLAPAELTLLAMVFWVLIGGGVAAVGVADLCHQCRVSRFTALVAIINLGIVVGAKILSPEPLALGLAYGGLALWLRERRKLAVFLLAASALTKETTLLIPWALALGLVLRGDRTRALLVALLVTAPIASWALWLEHVLPGNTASLEEISLPFVGLFHAAAAWFNVDLNTTAADALFGLIGLLGLGVSIMVAVRCRDPFVRAHVASWTLLALVLSARVWGRSPNALRALAPLWTFTVIGVGILRAKNRWSQVAQGPEDREPAHACPTAAAGTSGQSGDAPRRADPISGQ